VYSLRNNLLAASCLLLAAASASAEGELAVPPVADPAAAPVSEANVLASERFWPYYVSLREAWKPAASEEALGVGLRGVLIRVETSVLARVDFGRDGLQMVPIRVTDLIERANGIRTGEIEKTAPNFTLAIAPRLIDSGSDRMRPIPFSDALRARGFITVFATREQLREMAAGLAPMATRSDVPTIVFPQGEVTDQRVRRILVDLAWAAAFVFDHLAEAYTPSLLAEGLSIPAVMLQTAEGRVLFQSDWNPDAGRRLARALEENFVPGLTLGASSVP